MDSTSPIFRMQFILDWPFLSGDKATKIQRNTQLRANSVFFAQMFFFEGASKLKNYCKIAIKAVWHIDAEVQEKVLLRVYFSVIVNSVN